MKQERQNAFLAPPIQAPLDGLHVDSRLCLVQCKNLKLDIGMIHRNWLENDRRKPSDDTFTLIYFMVETFREKVELGIEEPLTKLEDYSLTVWLNSMKFNDPGLFNETFELVFPLTVTKHSYYGLLNSDYSFSMRLKYSRRPKRIYQERYIGVGYKDKGNHSSPHLDGSPSWGDITSYERYYLDAEKAKMLYNSKKDVARDSNDSHDLFIKSKKSKSHNLCTEQRKYFFKKVKDSRDKVLGYLLIKKEGLNSISLNIEVKDQLLIRNRLKKPLIFGKDFLIVKRYH